MDSELPPSEPTPPPFIDPSLRVIYRAEGGGVAVITPVLGCGLTLEEIVAKDVPAGAPCKVVDVSTIPTDRTFRAAWEHGDAGVTVSLPKAKAIHIERLRALRAPKLAALDIEYQKADEAVDQAAKRAIAAQKQALRDVTKVALPDDLEALASFKPDILI